MPIYYPQIYVDEGRKEADKLLRRMESEVHRIYRQAQSEMHAKADEYLKNFIKTDAEKRKLLAQGKITKAEYKQWRTSHMATGRRYFEYAELLSTDMTNSNLIAYSIINRHIPEMYAIGFNYGTYSIENQSLFDTSFTLYDRQTVERLIRDKPDLLPKATVKIPKDKLWNKNKINSSMIQSIIQGESIPQIAERISKVAVMSESQAVRNARTMATSAENGGRLDSYRRAENMGIRTEKTWIATHDRRTRPSHRHVDGETCENINEEFSNGCLFPGDPDADPEEIYNCRCTMICQVVKTELPRGNIRDELGEMTYQEWKESKPVYR